MMKKYLLFPALLFALLMPLHFASASLPVFTDVVDVLALRAQQSLSVEVPKQGTISLVLTGDSWEDVYTIAEAQPVSQGINTIRWDGLSVDNQVVPEGDYILAVYMDEADDPPEPEPTLSPELIDFLPFYAELEAQRQEETGKLIHDVEQSSAYLTSRGLTIDFTTREAGELSISLYSKENDTERTLSAMQVAAGSMSYRWEGLSESGGRVPLGEYEITLSLTTPAGESFAAEPVAFEVRAYSQPMTAADDGTFWSMNPGELDDDVIWEIMTQPIVVFNNYQLHPSGHVYLRENPDGTGQKIAQLHAMSQGVHVIGEVNEHGYVLVEAVSNYDPVYAPKTEEELATAFDVKQGYIEAKYLRTVEVSQDIGFLVDKLTQRMYIYIKGKPVTELVISTGDTLNGRRPWRETIPGEFITISFTGGFWNDEIYSDLGIRYNGGSLIHEVPCTFDADGRRVYAPFERRLGEKASAGCVRVPKDKNPNGYNMQWIWDRLLNRDGDQPHYKVLIWDDLNREDTPAAWYADRFYRTTAEVAAEMEAETADAAVADPSLHAHAPGNAAAAQ